MQFIKILLIRFWRILSNDFILTITWTACNYFLQLILTITKTTWVIISRTCVSIYKAISCSKIIVLSILSISAFSAFLFYSYIILKLIVFLLWYQCWATCLIISLLHKHLKEFRCLHLKYIHNHAKYLFDSSFFNNSFWLYNWNTTFNH